MMTEIRHFQLNTLRVALETLTHVRARIHSTTRDLLRFFLNFPYPKVNTRKHTSHIIILGDNFFSIFPINVFYEFQFEYVHHHQQQSLCHSSLCRMMPICFSSAANQLCYSPPSRRRSCDLQLFMLIVNFCVFLLIHTYIYPSFPVQLNRNYILVYPVIFLYHRRNADHR